MAERIQLSQGEANSSKGRIKSRADSWLQNMSTIEREVMSMANWFKGETGDELIKLYQRCQREIKREIEEFITEYNSTIDKSVQSLQSADSSLAKKIAGM